MASIITFFNMSKRRMELPLNKMRKTMRGAAFEGDRVSKSQCLTCKIWIPNGYLNGDINEAEELKKYREENRAGNIDMRIISV